MLIISFAICFKAFIVVKAKLIIAFPGKENKNNE